MNHHLLRQLTPTGQNQTLKLKIARLWETIIPTTKKFIGLDFIAVDSEGNAIHASIKREDVDFYRPLLKEGSLYQIFRFQVSGLKNSHNAVQKQHMIYLSKTSIVNELYEDMTAYPRYHFQFLTREQMAINANSDKYMIDVIGVLDSIGPIIQVQKRNRQMTDIRNIFIKELSGDILKVTVWNEFIPEIKEDELLNQKPKPILIFAGVIAKSFMGQISVSTSSGTAIYINLDIPETLLLRERYQDDQTYAQLLSLEDEDKARNNNPENNKKITIEDLLQFNPKNIQKTRYTCEAKIKNWNKHSGWFYKACNQCYQTLQGWADAFWCTQHGEKTPMLV